MAKITSWLKRNKGKVVGGVVGGLVLGGTAISLLSGRKHKSSNDDSASSNSGSSSSTSDDASSGTGTKKTTSTSSSSKTTVNKTKHEQSKIEKPNEIYIAPSQYSIQRAGLEVYRTDDEHYTQYISPCNEKAVDMTLVEVESDSESDETNVFRLNKGMILDTYYYTDLMSVNFDEDYKDMSQTGTINRESVNLQQFYKGVRICLLSEWEAPDTTLEWDDLNVAIEGFITEQTFKEKNVDIKVDGYTKLLEQQIPFKFKQMYRSEILREIILSAGLQPYINATGLDDDITDFTNEVKTRTASTQAIGRSSGNIGKLAQQLCQGKTSDLDKAQTIHSYIATHVDYPHPNYSDHHRCPMQVLATGISNCCDRARLGHEMANAVGLVNRGVHGPGHVWVQYKIKGKWVNSDPSYSRKKLGTVWKGLSVDSLWTFPNC